MEKAEFVELAKNNPFEALVELYDRQEESELALATLLGEPEPEPEPVVTE